jgi:type II secretory pathway pseudopilin PulG
MKLVRRVLARHQVDPESGLGLIELLFAMVIFTIVATGVAYGLQTATHATGSDRLRVQAASLAAREMDYTRHEFSSTANGPLTLASSGSTPDPHPLPGGTAGQPLLVDGVPFTVTRNVEWLPAGAGQSPCDGSGTAVTYPVLAVNVEVSWAQMGNVAPVESNTILTPPKGVVKNTISFVAVKVIDSNAQPQAGLPVTLTGTAFANTQTTSEDGCTVFSVANAGSYTATVTSPGFVDSGGNAVATRSAPVASTGSFVIPAPISYDQAAKLNVTMSSDAGYAVPTAALPVTLYNSGIQPTGSTVVTGSGSTRTITGLWPFSSGYITWPGSCAQSDPSANRSAATVVAGGGTGSVVQRLAPVALTVVKNSVALPGATIVAIPALATSCSSTENPMSLGVTNASGLLNTSLPAGTWTIQVSGGTAKTTWPSTGALTPKSGVTSVNVQTK